MAPEHDDTATFAVNLAPPGGEMDDGFNQYGVRENLDDDALDSIDVIFSAMKPGVRKGIEVTPRFLRNVAGGYSGSVPFMLDHSEEQLSQVGRITDAKFSEEYQDLRLIGNIPNTGNSVKSDVISDFTHSPPAIDDGSVGFNPRTLEFSEPENSEDAVARFTDGELIEFSLTPFPAGYDEGGLSPAFSEAIDSALPSSEKASDDDDVSQLVVNDSKLTTS